jgi:hypothetical protein
VPTMALLWFCQKAVSCRLITLLTAPGVCVALTSCLAEAGSTWYRAPGARPATRPAAFRASAELEAADLMRCAASCNVSRVLLL